MILTEVYGNIQDIPDLASWHVETAMVKSDDLLKAILRVTSDHGRDYGIRLEDEIARLEIRFIYIVNLLSGIIRGTLIQIGFHKFC